MMNPLAIWRAGVKALRSPRVLIDATVRPYDEAHAAFGMRQMPPTQELVARFVRWVKVAASRNAAAVAALNMRLMREADGDSAFKARRLGPAESKKLRRRFATKALPLDFDVEEVTDQAHPFVKLLRQPNPLVSGFGLLEHTELDLGLTGNSYWSCITGRNGWPVELWLLPSQFVAPIPDKQEIIAGYWYGRGFENRTRLEASDVIHFRRPNPTGDPYFGYGDLQGCIEEADLSTAMTLVGKFMVANGVRPGGVLEMPGATPEQLRQAREDLTIKHAGPHNYGKIMLVGGPDGMKFNAMPITDKELAFLESADRVRNTIAACFDMPVGLLNMEERSLANGKVVAPHWQKMAIEPRAMRIADTINARLMPAFREATGDESLFVVFDNAVDEDEDATATRISTLFTGRILTKNEARAELGYEPVEGGDEFDEPLPGLGGFGVNSPSQEAPDDGQRPGADGGDGDSGSAPDAKGRDARPRWSVVLGRVGSRQAEGENPGVRPHQRPVAELCDSAGTKARDGVCGDGAGSHAKARLTDLDIILAPSHLCCKGIRAAGDFTPDNQTAQLVQALQAFFSPEVIEQILRRIDSGEPIDMLALERAFDRAVDSAAEGVFAAGYDRGLAVANQRRPGIAVDVGFDVSNEQAQRFLQSYRIRLRQSVIRTMTNRLVMAAVSPIDKPAFVAPQNLNDALRVAVQEGDSLAGAIGRIRSEFENLSGVAAERIARTEGQRAYGEGKLAAWKGLPGVTHKRWLLSAQPCAMCRELAATRPVVEIDKPFATVGEVVGGVLITYADVYTNTLHPNDSCGMSMVFEDEA